MSKIENQQIFVFCVVIIYRKRQRKKRKNENIYHCSFCYFDTCKKTDYNIHFLTIKHKNNDFLKNDNEKTKKRKNYTCDMSQKDYTCMV